MKRTTFGALGFGVADTGALMGPAAAAAAVPAGAHQPTITVVARGLANPRGVTLVSGVGRPQKLILELAARNAVDALTNSRINSVFAGSDGDLGEFPFY